MMAAALNRVSPIGVYETRHLLNGLWDPRIDRLLEAGRRRGRAPRRVHRNSTADLDPNYYGQMSTQSEGHTVCSRHSYGAPII